MIKLYRFAHSTNVERVALALAHKQLAVESVEIDPADRSSVIKTSGQPLVPVIDDHGKVIADSMEIVRYLEARYPERPLYPKDAARRAEMLVFIEWFNKVWKRPPNDIEAELGKTQPDQAQIAAWGRQMTDWLDVFEDLLTGRDHLFGAEFSAADVCAFPFVKYGLLGLPPGDDYLFHKILEQYQPIGSRYPKLAAWVRRVDQRPRV